MRSKDERRLITLVWLCLIKQESRQRNTEIVSFWCAGANMLLCVACQHEKEEGVIRLI